VEKADPVPDVLEPVDLVALACRALLEWVPVEWAA
jgi:hypothetical protein